MRHRTIVVAGPSGSGKSTVGAALAARIGVPFVEGDDLHPSRNREKMAAGVALDETDRRPWLLHVGDALASARDGVVVACSALRRSHRRLLLGRAPQTWFVALEVPHGELERRMHARKHFMPPSLLASQLAAWEPLAPDEPGVAIENVGPADRIVDAILASPEGGSQSLR